MGLGPPCPILHFLVGWEGDEVQAAPHAENGTVQDRAMRKVRQVSRR